MSYFITYAARFFVGVIVVLIAGCTKNGRGTNVSPTVVVCPVAEHLPTEENAYEEAKFTSINGLRKGKSKGTRVGARPALTKPLAKKPVLKAPTSLHKKEAKSNTPRSNLTENQKSEVVVAPSPKQSVSIAAPSGPSGASASKILASSSPLVKEAEPVHGLSAVGTSVPASDLSLSNPSLPVATATAPQNQSAPMSQSSAVMPQK